MTCPVIITEEENWIVAKDANSEVASQGKTINEALAKKWSSLIIQVIPLSFL
jgi:predicted RNase H-like HicB family nuclease